MSDLASQLASTGRVHAGLQDQGPTITKSQANYRPSDKPNQSCKECKHFDGKTSCEIVAGHIQPDHVSDHFEPKGGHSGSGSSHSSSASDSKSGGTSDSTGSSDSGSDTTDSGSTDTKDEGLQ